MHYHILYKITSTSVSQGLLILLPLLMFSLSCVQVINNLINHSVRIIFVAVLYRSSFASAVMNSIFTISFANVSSSIFHLGEKALLLFSFCVICRNPFSGNPWDLYKSSNCCHAPISFSFLNIRIWFIVFGVHRLLSKSANSFLLLYRNGIKPGLVVTSKWKSPKMIYLISWRGSKTLFEKNYWK